MTKIHGSYDAIVMRYERAPKPKVKKKFPCDCKILENGRLLLCWEHWELRQERNWSVEDMLEFLEGGKK